MLEFSTSRRRAVKSVWTLAEALTCRSIVAVNIDQDVHNIYSRQSQTRHYKTERENNVNTSASNEEDMHNTTTHSTNGTESINVPPVITSEFELEYFVPIFHSTPLSLFCQANNTVVRYQWYKNDLKIVENDRVSCNQSTGEIVFRNLEKEDFGIYYCMAENKFGISVSLFVKLSEAVLDQFSLTSNVEQTCMEYHHCTLICHNQPFCQPKTECMIEWKLGYGTTRISYNESVTLDREGNLHFLNISKSDGGQNYTCGMWNEKIRVLKMGDITNLKINDSTKDVIPEAVYQSGDKVSIGENATLQCIFSGNPVPKVEWQNKNGTTITTNHKYDFSQYGRQLHILNVTFDDEGFYKCIANKNLTQRPFLNVTCPPLFPDVGKRFMTKIVHISTKESTLFLCNTMSLLTEDDPVVIKWMKNGKILDEDIRNMYQLSEDKKSLHIYNIKSYGTGCYTCVIENSEGIAVANFLVPFAHVMTTALRAIIIAFVGLLLLIIAAIFIYKRACIVMKDKKLTARFQIARTSNLFPDPDDSTGPITEEPEYTYVDNRNTHTCSDGVEAVTKFQYEDVCDENHYNILGECRNMTSEYAESNLYDYSENMLKSHSSFQVQRSSHLPSGLQTVSQALETYAHLE
ncbi:contactin-1-like [Saccostrea echinata]|uniref:contactin-1-like n=1 Tax=Saccostrea echinata TaxID=191078 RepID=UPI002A81E20B|nr:contactin-1-like [Saccostrea echinata]